MKRHLCNIIMLMISFQIAKAQSSNGFVYKEYDSSWIVLEVDQQYGIDINEDGIPDVSYETFFGGSGSVALASYAFAINGWTACNHCIEPVGQNNIFYDLSTPFNDTTLVFGDRCLAEYYTYGMVPPLIYKVGLKYCDGQDCYYGWLEFEEDREGSSKALLHISKTCFCTIPNYPLRWGQTSLNDVDENSITSFATLHPNPTTGLVTITGQDLKSAEVFNAIGQKVAIARSEGETMQIDLSELPTGVYFVNIADKEGRKCVRKVVKE